jgi:tetratricopeptide (TPR) repeat protein
VYNTREGSYKAQELFWLPPVDRIPLDRVSFAVAELRAVPADPRTSSASSAKTPARPGSLRRSYECLAADLEAKGDDLTTLDRVDLGACYLRLRRYEDARRVLEKGDRKHFLILANLASAYHGLDLISRAIAFQEQALAAWPSVWAGWTGEKVRFYRMAERYYLKLLRLRERDQPREGGRPAAVQTVDALFPRVRFVGPDGRYQAGELAPAHADELPPYAYTVVLQLVLWQPFDDRLYWLLGELLNAGGEVDIASGILDELVSSRGLSGWGELVAHRRVLMRSARARAALRSNLDVWNSLSAALMFRGQLLPPVAGPVAYEAVLWQPRLMPSRGDQVLPVESSAAAPPGPRWALDWRQLAVGFGAGLAVALLGGLQWREWRRRRPARPARAPAPAQGPRWDADERGFSGSARI